MHTKCSMIVFNIEIPKVSICISGSPRLCTIQSLEVTWKLTLCTSASFPSTTSSLHGTREGEETHQLRVSYSDFASAPKCGGMKFKCRVLHHADLGRFDILPISYRSTIIIQAAPHAMAWPPWSSTAVHRCMSNFQARTPKRREPKCHHKNKKV